MGASALYWLQEAYVHRVSKVAEREVWVTNSACFALRADKCFSMHTQSTMTGKFADGDYDRVELGNLLDTDDHITKMVKEGKFTNLHAEYKKTGVELVTPDGYDDTLEYPIAEVVEAFNSYYFTCTPAYMIAMAMLCDPKVITIFGFDFDYADPRGVYEAGKPCVEYWIGRAQARGIEIRLPRMTNLMSTMTLQRKGLYGYGYEQPEFRLGPDGRARVTGFKNNPEIGNGGESAQAVPIGGGSDYRDGADEPVLAAKSVHESGRSTGDLDNQLWLSGIAREAQLLDAHGCNDEGDRAGRGKVAREDTNAGQFGRPEGKSASEGVQRETSQLSSENGHNTSDLRWREWIP